MKLITRYSIPLHYDNGESDIYPLYFASLTQSSRQKLDTAKTDDMKLKMSSAGLEYKLAIDTGELLCTVFS